MQTSSIIPALASWTASEPPARAAPCPYCGSRHCCLPGPVYPGGQDALPQRIAVARNEPLYHAGEMVREQVYMVRVGSFKHMRTNQLGQARIMGFHMSGDVLALDSIGLAWHQSSAVALEDSVVCAIGYPLMRRYPAYFHALASAGIARLQATALQLRRTTVQQKLAAFLLDMACEFRARGYAARHYRLPMQQKDIANFLDITPASASRVLEQFRHRRLIDTAQREVVLRDPAGLSSVAANGLDIAYGG